MKSLNLQEGSGRHGESQKGLDRSRPSGIPSSPSAPVFIAFVSMFLLLHHIFCGGFPSLPSVWGSSVNVRSHSVRGNATLCKSVRLRMMS